MENLNNEQDSNKINTPIQNMVRDSQKDSTVGPLIGSIIIILIIIGGGLYFWGSIIVNQKAAIENKESIEGQSQTSELEAIAEPQP